MLCPHCKTENRDDRAACYHCGRDLTLLRLILNKAKSHFNEAVKLAEEGSYYEALGELNGALELNSQMIEAHVLQGSILARLDRSDEARDALHRALALRPNAARAHRYLQQLEQVEDMAPLRRRLRAVLLTSAGVAVVAIALGMSTLLTGPDEVLVDHPARVGWAALLDGNYGEARRVAIGLDDQAAHNELMNAVDLAIESRIEGAAVLARAGDFEGAAALLLDFEGKKLPPDLESQIRREREDLIEHMAQDLAGMAAKLGAVQMPLVMAERDRLAELFPPASDELHRVVNEHVRREVAATEARLTALELALDANAPADQVRPLLDELRAGWLPQDDAATTATGLVARATEVENRFRLRETQRQAQALYGRAAEAARENRQPDFETALGELRSLEPRQDDVIAQAEGLRTVFIERQREELMNALRDAMAQRDPVRAAEVADSLDQLGATLDQQTREEIEEVRRSATVESYYQLMEMGEKIETAALTQEEARQVLRLVERARGPLPPRMAAKATENLHYFAAMAHRALGQTEEEARELEALRSGFPQSAWLVGQDSRSAEEAEGV